MRPKGQPSNKQPLQLDRDEIRPRLRELRTGDYDQQDPDVLQRIVQDLRDPGEDLAWLAAYDLDPDVSNGAIATLFHVLWDNPDADDLTERIREQAGPVLKKAMQNPRVPDSRKLSLGPLYGVCMGEISDQEYRSFFNDFQGASNRMMTEAINSVSGSPQSIDAVMAAMMSMVSGDDDVSASRFEATQLLASRMVDTKPGVAAAVLAANIHIAYTEDVALETLEAAVEALEKCNCPEALWLLDDMSHWPAMGAFSDRLRRAATKLKLMGIQPDYSYAPTFSHALVSGPDGSAVRQMSLFFRTPDGGMDLLALLLKEGVGIKDAVCVFEEGAEREAQLRNDFSDILIAPCTLDYCRELVAEALLCHEQTKTPLPGYWAICRPYLGPAPIIPQTREINLTPFHLEALDAASDLVDGSESMAETLAFGSFTFTSDRAYDFVAGCMPKRGARLAKTKFNQFLDAITQDERETLLRHIAQTLEVEALAGRAVQPENRAAARLWLGLSQNVVPFTQVPFVRAIAELSVDMIIHNLRMGFRNQIEADQASLEMEFGGDEYFDEDEDH